MIKKQKMDETQSWPPRNFKLSKVNQTQTIKPHICDKDCEKVTRLLGSKKKKMARASQRGPQRLVVNAEQVLYRQKERVRTIQVLGTV